MVCFFLGHLWQSKTVEDYWKDGSLWERIYTVEHRHCKRCGEPNPYYRSNK